MTNSKRGGEHGRTTAIEIGRVSAPSGTLVVLDMGYLYLWCHDRPPVFPEGMASEKVVASANSQADFEIVGPDAEKAGRLFNRQWHPLYLYDIPAHGFEGIRQSFAEVTAKHNLVAGLRPLDRRISHRQRIDLARDFGHGAGEFIFQGIWASAVGGLPKGQVFDVLVDEMEEDPHRGRLQRVYIEVLPNTPTAKSEQVGHAGVDYARLMFADADALGAWQHEKPLDGLADFLFWGRDAARAASLTDAPQLSEGHFGWTNMPVADVAKKGVQVEDVRKNYDMKFATDFRPHSHHHAILEQMRDNPTESGTLEVGGALVCSFFTRWGDGIFPVFRDLADDGHLVRIRIEIGTSDRVELMQKAWERAEFMAKRALVSKRVAEDGQPVCWLYREAVDRDADSGWRVFAGDETEEYNDDANNIALVSLQDLCGRDRRLESIFQNPIGSAFERGNGDEDFSRVEGFDVPDESSS
jgi:hypothetical protein